MIEEMRMRLLEGKTALITGGAQGLGHRMALRMADEGAFVFIADMMDSEKASRTLELPDSMFYLKLDVTCEEDWVQAFQSIRESGKNLDILVNNAGINIREPIEEMTVEHLDAMMAVNIRGPFLGIKHAIPVMRELGGGSIINISSICGLVGHKYTTEAYTTTKGAITMLTKSVAVRYASDNIRCNSIHPSTVDTPLIHELFKDPEKKKQRFDEIPLGRLADADEVAFAAVYLACDRNSFMNGVQLPVDGGLTAY